MAEAQVAVLIDYENVGLDPMEALLDQISDVGRIIIKRAYADWSTLKGQHGKALELGIEAMHHFHSSKSGKNSSDISLAIDAVDLLHNSPVDTFVIASADTDFVPLVRRLRAAGKLVIGAGRRAVVSDDLVRSCDRYIFLDDLVPPAQKPRPTSDPAPLASADADALVLRAMAVSMDDEGELTGSKLHETMRRIDPSFEYKAVGFRTFSQFLEQNQDIEVSRSSARGDVLVRLKPTEPGSGAVKPAPRRRRSSGGRGRPSPTPE
ncbi:MAG: NYN domain-containing protein [Chloroflexi bacterium]|nr:NYN domain-containing protein [Chloroflexota bacterium]